MPVDSCMTHCMQKEQKQECRVIHTGSFSVRLDQQSKGAQNSRARRGGHADILPVLFQCCLNYRLLAAYSGVACDQSVLLTRTLLIFPQPAHIDAHFTIFSTELSMRISPRLYVLIRPNLFMVSQRRQLFIIESIPYVPFLQQRMLLTFRKRSYDSSPGLGGLQASPIIA